MLEVVAGASCTGSPRCGLTPGRTAPRGLPRQVLFSSKLAPGRVRVIPEWISNACSEIGQIRHNGINRPTPLHRLGKSSTQRRCHVTQARGWTRSYATAKTSGRVNDGVVGHHAIQLPGRYHCHRLLEMGDHPCVAQQQCSNFGNGQNV
jgi:hypothetical protein